jgi:hypothetical protein
MRERKTVKRLREFLEKEYINADGGQNLSSAIRDMLTDTLHLIDYDKIPIDIDDRLSDARETYWEEKDLEE